MEKSPAGLTYTPDFTKDARFRALELLLTGVIRHLPDADRFRQHMDTLIDLEQTLYETEARKIPAPARVSALELVNSRMEEIRDEVSRIFQNRVPPAAQ
ncbi:hypothetical protein [Luteibacter yeojuensis]|uniref:Uncharacterized protein n=1 Tax=Luteibacter yeojuensis TaxID=345309 RepID=A0A7X5QU12_9GAMM|nr:hypothetical protein [Luteibacter yeojuensis]NID15412.1 hypothetical protein [Luteibacter yeojuensis]